MEWSYSGSKTFYRCQRRWYFQNVVANSHPKAKNQLRREAHLLSQLQSLEAWRGSIVDRVLEKELIRPLDNVKDFSEQRLWKYARELFDDQLRFARKFRSREPGMSKTKAGDQYASLYDVEYGIGLDERRLEQAWEDVKLALANVLSSEQIMNALRQADQLVAQRTLYLREDDFIVKAIPDVIAFYEDAPPLIIDWKVQTTGLRDYWLQLACYALALTRSEPHKDFYFILLGQYAPSDLRLVEFQLLLPHLRWYSLTNEDVEVVEEYIFTSANGMLLSLGDDGVDVIRPFEFSVTQHAQHCQTCPFQKMCGADILWAS